MLRRYLDADATVVERISKEVKGSKSSIGKDEEHIVMAKKEIEKFGKAWGSK
jgi:hypothetical protein